ncbi:hypothetical protein MVES_003101 [Malassezia vespertilionis]|uniref:Uncharacterized protein n=1 Tax=Malassezia vespertilionis TaxID=2020962 RepID=A0A2N1J984_9BASI|nr:hypothetical protein MVES_003101 [Malassezia vespertilionis]
MESPLVNILQDDSLPIRIAKVTPDLVRLADGVTVPPTCIFLNGQAFVWTPPKIDAAAAVPSGKGWEAWSNDIWTLFELVFPKPVLPVPARIKAHLHSVGIQLDVQSTRNACSTYNLLSEEGRRVSAALLPMTA